MIKKEKSLVFLFCFILLFGISFVSSFSGGGEGTPAIPYNITSCSQLNETRNALYATYVLGKDIDCTNFPFNPIGSDTTNFNFVGTLDGTSYNFKIMNLNVSKTSNDVVGLFAELGNGAVVKNIEFTNLKVKASNYAGAIAGKANYKVVLQNIKISSDSSLVTIGGTGYIGGLIGYLNGVTNISISNCQLALSVSGSNRVGGFLGYVDNSGSIIRITNSSNLGNITGSGNYIGGFIGDTNAPNIILTNISNSGSLLGGQYTGGIIGMAVAPLSMNQVVNTGNFNINAGSNDVGGLIGSVTGAGSINITNSRNSGSVHSNERAGGFIGYITNSGAIVNIINSNNSGSFNIDANYAGGFIGRSDAGTNSFSNLINSGNISGDSNVGGLMGSTGGALSISNSINFGKISTTTAGTSNVGGLAGIISGVANISNSNNYGSVVSPSINVGGLVGASRVTTIFNSTNNASIRSTGERRTGGLVGNIDNPFTITQSSNSGNVSSSYSGEGGLGGLVGYVYNVAYKIVNSSNSGTINATSTMAGVGGLVGREYGGSVREVINSCENSGAVSSGGRETGGLVGIATYVNISKSSNSGKISGTNIVGGLVGMSYYDSTISDSYNIAEITGTGDYVGGLIGANGNGGAAYTKTKNSYNIGIVRGSTIVGGLIGSFSTANNINNYIKNSFSTGTVISGSPSGSIYGQGIVSNGNNDYALAYQNGVYVASSANYFKGLSVTTLPPFNLGWDFTNAWATTGGYPILKWQWKPGDQDNDGYLETNDCNDNNPGAWQNVANLGIDMDGDGSVVTDSCITRCVGDINNGRYGNGTSSNYTDYIFATCSTYSDCNDSSAVTYPNATEICDGMINMCGLTLADNVSMCINGRNACNDSQTMFRLYSLNNSQAMLWNYSYGIRVCYNDSFSPAYTGANPHDCKGGYNELFGLYFQTFSNVSNNSESPNIPVCYGNLSCNVSDTCGAGETPILNLSDFDNALASLSSYPKKVCCKVSGQISIGGAIWSSLDKNIAITNSSIGDTVLMQVSADNVGNAQVNYTIKAYNTDSSVWWNPFSWTPSWNSLAQLSGKRIKTYLVNSTLGGKKLQFQVATLDNSYFNNSGNLTIGEVVNNSLPIASFSGTYGLANLNFPLNGLKVRVYTNIIFTQNSSDEDDLLRINWDFRDGTPSVDCLNYFVLSEDSCNINHSFSSSGLFKVKLKASELLRGQYASTTRNVFVFKEGVNSIPVIISPNDNVLYSNLSTSFNASGSFVVNCSIGPLQTGGLGGFSLDDGSLNCTYLHKPFTDRSFVLSGYNLIFNWLIKNTDTRIVSSDVSVAGSWSNYSSVVEFNYPLINPGIQNAKLTMSYNKTA